MFNLKDLKVALAECHVTESSLVYKTLREINNPSYFLLRAKEAMAEIEMGVNEESNLVLAIQLLNMRRVLCKVPDVLTTLRDPDNIKEP